MLNQPAIEQIHAKEEDDDEEEDDSDDDSDEISRYAAWHSTSLPEYNWPHRRHCFQFETETCNPFPAPTG